jgi:2',3'-cyclic-nucleotide 2'-phosphodiesterase (5'-nucleotidase family)
MRRYPSYFLIIILLFSSCKTVYQPQAVAYTDYRINNNGLDSSIIKLLQPYADSVNKSMNDVVAVSVIELEKKQPEGTLGNMMTDAMFTKAKQVYDMPIDAAFINNGGLRLPSIPVGKITRGKIFELAPFDNTIVIQKLSGKILQQFLNHISSKGGWPTAGCSWQIKDKNAVNVLLNGLPIDETTVYNIAMIDYVANGGDDCIMLKNIPQISKGFLLRDAILEYLADFTKQGKTVSSKIEKRVTNAE